MNLVEAVTGFLIFSILIMSFMPAIMSLNRLDPTVNLTLTNAVQSHMYGLNEDIQQLATRKDCKIESWSSDMDESSQMIVVEAECKGQPLNIGRFIYAGY